MRRSHLASLSTNGLWMLREKIAVALAAKIAAEKDLLETRLRLLTQGHRQAVEHRGLRRRVARNAEEHSGNHVRRGDDGRHAEQLRPGYAL